MNTYLMKKALIETAVGRGIKEMEDDPERSVRRLVDLGKQFSKNRFQDQVFSVMQKLLNNENSAYYDMLSNLIRNSDHEAMKKFGVNFGYMGWTYGAATIRSEEEQNKVCIPWTMLLRYNPSVTDGLTISRMKSLLDQGTALGIYAWFIREVVNSADSYELLELLEKYKDSAFVWIKDDGRLTAAQIQMLKVCRNTVVSLPIEDPESILTAALLRDQKIIFAMHMNYGSDINAASISSIMENVLTSETALFFLIADDNVPFEVIERTRKFCYDSRLQQEYPCCLMDYIGDASSLSKVVVEHPHLVEILSDGTLMLPASHKSEPFPFDQPLLDVFRSVMPSFPVRRDEN